MKPASLRCPTCKRHISAAELSCPHDGTDLVALAATTGLDPLIGMTIGEYKVEKRIGLGGMGIVYRGKHPMIGKLVAIKVLRPELAEDPIAIKRLLEEARALALVRHRGITDILGFGTMPQGQRQYLVMEYLEGRGLDLVMHEAGAMPPIEAVRLLEEIVAAIGAAHSAGVLHRDLKPSNVFLVKQAGAQFVKLLDFGMAKRTDGGRGMSQMTTGNMAMGTPHYISPEQAAGKKVGPQTDLYSIGVIAFEMVTGRLPFVSENPLELLHMHVEQPAPRASSIVPDLPKMLDRFIAGLLEKDPARRPRSADDVVRALAQVKMAISMGKTITHRR